MKSIAERIVQLKLTAAIVVEGAIVRAGSLVEMVESEAKDLLRRGKAELHAVIEAVEGDEDTNVEAAKAAAEAAMPNAFAEQADEEKPAAKRKGGN